MTTANQDLHAELQRFRHSSAFTPGDAFSFSVSFNHELSLPGKFDPSDYLVLCVGQVDAQSVAVICPGNGGLCAELLRRGAERVVAYEPRNQYFTALDKVAEITEAVHGKTFEVERGLPGEDAGPFDLILWPEGLDEIRDPVESLRWTIGALRSGGKLIIEATHGTHGASPATINAWRPKPEAFAETLRDIGDCEIRTSHRGRNGSRKIYDIVSTAPLKVEPLQVPDYSEIEDVDYFQRRIANALAIPENFMNPAADAENPEPEKQPSTPLETASAQEPPKPVETVRLCSICREPGHNRRSCPTNPAPQRGKKRRRKSAPRSSGQDPTGPNRRRRQDQE